MKESSWKISNDFESKYNTGELPVEYFLSMYDLMYYLQSADKVYHPLGVGFYALDYSKGNFLYVGSNFEKITGHTPDELKEGGIERWRKIIHPDDRTAVFRSLERESNIILNEYKQRYYVFNGSYRIISSHGIIKQVIQKSTIYYNSKHLNSLLEIGMITEIIFPKERITGHSISVKTGRTNPPPIADHEEDPILSEREREIDALIKRRLSSKEISGILNISIHTVNAHRRKINEKKSPEKKITNKMQVA